MMQLQLTIILKEMCTCFCIRGFPRTHSMEEEGHGELNFIGQYLGKTATKSLGKAKLR